MASSESSTRLEDIKPVRSRTPRDAASSSSARSKPLGEDEVDGPSVISHVHGEGDVTVGSVTGAPTEDPGLPPADSGSRSLGNRRSSSLQRIKSSLSKTQSQIVEIFSRKNSLRKLGKNKRSDLDTIVASSSSTSSNSEPRLIAAHKKPSTPAINNHSSRRLQYRQFSKNLEGIPENDEPSSIKRSTSNHSRIKQSSTSIQLPKNCGANFSPRDSKNGGTPPPFGDELETNELHKLREENRQLWEDNRILASTLEDLQPKMEYLQGRNKYLEVAIYQEGKVLTDIIKQCHEEIARLKATQCELMSGGGGGESIMGSLKPDKDADFEKKIREYYITKYSNCDEGSWGDEEKEFR